MMIHSSALAWLGRMHPPGTPDDPVYAFAAGSAMQCWLHGSKHDREHHDTDIVVFQPDFLQSRLGIDFRHTPHILAKTAPGGIALPSSLTEASMELMRGAYFHCEIVPTAADVRSTTIDSTPLLALSPEFIAISKISYPNLHRAFDFYDVMRMNRAELLRDHAYSHRLLEQTALGKLVRVTDIIGLRSQEDVQGFVDSIHRLLIRRFLYWDWVHVEVLNQLQIFVLLDIDEQTTHLTSEQFANINAILARTALEGRRLQLARLGLFLIMAGASEHQQDILSDDALVTILLQALDLISVHPGLWIAGAKTLFTLLQNLIALERLGNGRLQFILAPDTIRIIARRMFFDQTSHFVLPSTIRSLYSDLKDGIISVDDCISSINNLLALARL